MELRHLRYFCAVAESKSFTQAARRLHVSQSAVSGQVRDLEEEIGVRLLSRDRHAVSLTPEGTIFLREACEILERSQRAKEMAVRASQGQLGKLAVGLCGPSTALFLPRLIRSFRKSYPGIALAMKDLDPARQPEALANGEIDIGFTRSVPSEYQKRLGSEVLFQEPIVAVVPKGHPLAGKQTISAAALASERFVLYAREAAPELFDAIIGICKRAGFSPQIVGTPALMQTVLSLVEAGEGVALLPACARTLRSNGVTFHQLQGGCLVDVVVAWRRNEDCAVREAFLALVRKNRPDIGSLGRSR
jgi:DNA-binding transcriptional LysR family regulator